MSNSRPSPWQYVTYSYGRTLPESMNDWVAEDLGGRGAAVRTSARFVLPYAVVLGLMWLIPAEPVILAGVTAIMFLSFLPLSVALNPMYRRGRLMRHGLDPELADAWVRRRDAALINEYEDRFSR